MVINSFRGRFPGFFLFCWDSDNVAAKATPKATKAAARSSTERSSITAHRWLTRSRRIISRSGWCTGIISTHSARSSEKRIVESRMHSATRPKARTHGGPERVMRSKSRGIEISVSNIIRVSPSWETWGISSRRAIHFELVFESGRGKVPRWVGSTWCCSQGVIKGVWTSRLWEVISEGIAGPTGFRLSSRCLIRIFIAFLEQPRGEFLDHVDLKKSEEIIQSSVRNENIAESTCEIVRGLQRESRPGDIIFGRKIERAGAIVA